MFNKLMKVAKKLETHLNTEWAEEHESLYNNFASRIEYEYAAGNITAKEFNELAMTAFYDYPDGLKEEE